MPDRSVTSTNPSTPDEQRMSADRITPTDGTSSIGVAAAEVPLDAASRVRYESELRRLRDEIELDRSAMAQLNGRLRQAEQEAAEASGAVVAAMAVELAAWQDRAQQADSELVAIRASVLYRAASPFLTVYRLRRRLPAAARALVRRLGST